MSSRSTRSKNKPPEEKMATIWGRYKIQGKWYFEVQWKGFSMRDNTLEPIANVSNSLKQQLKETRDSTVENNETIRQVIAVLQDHTNEIDEDMLIFAQNWLTETELSPYQIALGIAMSQGWQWLVLKKESEKTKQDVASLKLIYNTSAEFSVFAASPDQMPQRGTAIELDQDEAVEEVEEKKATLFPWGGAVPAMLYKPVDETRKVKLPHSEQSVHLYQFDAEELKGETNLLEIFNKSVVPVDECPEVAFLDLEVHKMSYLFTLSQLCAVSLNGQVLLNRYIRHYPMAYLDPQWKQLVVDGYVDMEPADDPDTAVAFLDAIDLLCERFEKPGTCFIFQGNADYSWLIANFRNHLKDPRLSDVLTRFREKQYRFVSQENLFKISELPKRVRTTKKRKLEKNYALMFVDSLIFHSNMQTFLYSWDVQKRIHDECETAAGRFPFVDPGFPHEFLSHRNRDYERVDICFWTDSMLPVFHNAHTDALVLRNMTIGVLIYLVNAPSIWAGRGYDDMESMEPKKRDGLLELIWNEIMTCLVCKTAVFHKYHLGCSRTEIQKLLFKLIMQNDPAVHNSLYAPIAIAHRQLEDPVLDNDDSHEANARQYASSYSRPLVPSPESSLAVFKNAKPVDDKIKEPKDALYEFTPYQDYDKTIRTNNPDTVQNASMKTAMRELIYESNNNIEGDGSKLPVQFQFFRSDLQNFEAMIDEKDTTRLRQQPSIVVMKKDQSESFPKTYILHAYGCRHVGIQNSAQGRSAADQSLNIIDWSTNPAFSFRLRFCKDCKKWDSRFTQLEPHYNPKAAKQRVQQKEQDTLGRILSSQREQLNAVLDTVNNRPVQQIVVQAPPVYINNPRAGAVTRSRATAVHPPRAPVVGRPFSIRAP